MGGVNPWDLPFDATRNDIYFGRDELGRTLYQTRFGHIYSREPVATVPRKSLAEALGPIRDAKPSDALALAKALAGGVMHAIGTPGRALRGEPVTLGDTFATAGLASLGTAAAPASAGVSRASRTASLYTRPTKSEVGDVLGRQHTGGVDVEGRPLVARYVVGRAPERTREQSLPSEALAEIVEATTGRPIEGTPARGLRGGAVGQTRFDRYTGKPLAVEIRDGLPPRQFDAVARHETGHLIDEVAGQIDTKGLGAELQPLYHFGIEGRERATKQTRPTDLGYTKAEAPREYMAEALRQYMSAPDTMKQMAPKTAARIRAAVNAHPELSKLVQFNAIGGGGLIFGGLYPPRDDLEQRTRAWLAGL